MRVELYEQFDMMMTIPGMANFTYTHRLTNEFSGFHGVRFTAAAARKIVAEYKEDWKRRGKCARDYCKERRWKKGARLCKIHRP